MVQPKTSNQQPKTLTQMKNLLYFVQQSKEADSNTQYLSLLIKELKDQILELRQMQKQNEPHFKIQHKIKQIRQNIDYRVEEQLRLVYTQINALKQDFEEESYYLGQ